MDAPPLGLGLRACAGGHYLQALGLTVARVEEPSVTERLDEFYLRSEAEQAEALRVPKGCFAESVWPASEDEEEGIVRRDQVRWMKGEEVEEPIIIPEAAMSTIV